MSTTDETYTRVNISTKQTTSGMIQMDIVAEAPSVKEACRLIKNAIDRRKKDITKTLSRMKKEGTNNGE